VQVGMHLEIRIPGSESFPKYPIMNDVPSLQLGEFDRERSLHNRRIFVLWQEPTHPVTMQALLQASPW
jgi:hypothetical protein